MKGLTVAETNAAIIKHLKSFAKVSRIYAPTDLIASGAAIDAELIEKVFTEAAGKNKMLQLVLPKTTHVGGTDIGGRVAAFGTQLFDKVAQANGVSVDEVKLSFRKDDGLGNGTAPGARLFPAKYVQSAEQILRSMLKI